ncbi:transcription termination factor, mitochondrial-like [Bradysia coprophila]|uniref:transcription termination factor, mitochondrial-like n=1 Tax=Bradysia coprophila TaxID=38358 RepID=UPI00187D9BBE|nr:transcription termination factor, mitochondrial-like [Bradysia coprophila]
MIRSLVRCAGLQRYLLAPVHFRILSNQIVLSSANRYQINDNGQLNPQLVNTGNTDDSNSATPNIERERITTTIIDVLQDKLNCSREWAQQFGSMHSELLSKATDVLKSIELLLANGVRENVILDNPRMITLSHSELSTNLSIVKEMKPIDINDFAPLVQVSKSKLLKLKKLAEREETIVPKKHRIYYISDAMNIEPCIVTKFIAERLFVLTEPFAMIDQNLQVLLKYIAPIDLLHDLWAFKYSADIIEERLKRAREGNKEKCMPWMIRCTDKKLSTSIKIASDAKAIVGDKTLVKYLAERLKYNVKTTEAILRKHPSVFNCRVTRMKETLDYLFAAGFVSVDIAETPRVFCHSLTTIRKRVEELNTVGCRPQLYIICRSSKEYNKFFDNWMRVRDKCKQKNVIDE